MQKKKIQNGCLKIPSLGITVLPHSASLVMPNSYSHDRIFNPNLTTIRDMLYMIYFNSNIMPKYLDLQPRMTSSTLNVAIETH